MSDLNKKVAKRFGDFKKSPYLCNVKTIKINFNLSDNERIIFIRADWVDEEFKSSVEVDVAELLCRDINRDAGREVVRRTLNCIDAKDSHVYFKLFEFNNYTSIKVYERKFKVDMVK